MTNFKLPHNWTRREDQYPLWEYLNKGGKRAVQVAHRRWGKDDVSLHYTALAAHRKIATYWHMLPQYGQARKAIWEAVNPRTGKKRIDEAFPEEIRAATRKNDMFIEFKCGSTWQLVGSDNYDATVGSPPAGIVFSEWALADPMAWAYLSPILEENGGWAIFIYTSRGANHGLTMYNNAKENPTWFSSRITAYDTDVFTPEQLAAIEQENINIFGPELGKAMFAQEYLCSWEGAILGAYYASEMAKARAENRITKVTWQPGVEVDTFWDLGVDDSMSIWFMQPGGRNAYHWIDYVEGTGYALGYYAKILKEKPYIYGNHYMPHDVKKRVLDTNVVAKTVKEQAESLGIKPIIKVDRARNMDIVVKEHIPACRYAIGQSWFDEKKCARGVSALENYRANYDEKKKVLSPYPLHDHNSHAADAFRTFAAGYKVNRSERVPVRKQKRSWMTA